MGLLLGEIGCVVDTESAPMEDAGATDGPRVLRSPPIVSQAARDAHETSHIPFRDWDPFCQADRGRERGHFRRHGAQDEFLHVSFDYTFLTGDACPVLVAKDRWSGMVFAQAAMEKGAADPTPPLPWPSSWTASARLARL